jgi:thiol-disulfide isomerase/thioredoxin
MIRAAFCCVSAFVIFLNFSTAALAKPGDVNTLAADFPPGPFTDGHSYSLEDYRGKIVVVFFFEPTCPTCRAKWPEYNALVKTYKDKPVQFLAVASNITAESAKTYQQQTPMEMPAYPDSLGLMQKRYSQQISLQNIHQTRVVGPTGKILAYDMSKETLDKIIKDAKPEWKFKGEKYDDKLQPALDAFEAGRYAAGMKLLAPLRKSTNKALAESAQKLFDEVKKEGDAWKDEADKVAENDPVHAYDLYTKITAVFPGDDLAKSVAEPLKQLAAKKAVVAELTARKAFASFVVGLEKAAPPQKAQMLKSCQDLAKKYDGTQVGAKASELAKDLSAAP